jgi:hypothetical protein
VVAIQPESSGSPGSLEWTGAAEPPRQVARRRRRPILAALLAILAVFGLVVAGAGIFGQVMPRFFTPTQRRQIEAWEMARRWRVTPRTQIFPIRIHYRLSGEQIGSASVLTLTARRLEIAQQSSCASAAGASAGLIRLLDRRGCQALLRATYTDASSSLVLTVGVAVLRNGASAMTAARYLTHGTVDGPGSVTVRPLLSPIPVSGTPAAAFGTGQRQLSWAISAGPYLVLATVGYADGRPRVPVVTDVYAYLEMTSLADGVAGAVAKPLGARPPVPRCPGASAC